MRPTWRQRSGYVAAALAALLLSVEVDAGGVSGCQVSQWPPPNNPDSIEDVVIWQLILETETGTSSGAGSDATIKARLRPGADGVVTLDSTDDDWESGDVRRYFINPTSVRKVEDIEQLELINESDDGWCVAAVALYVNDDPRPIFRNRPSSCELIDGDGETDRLTFSRSALRSYRHWSLRNRTRIAEPPALITSYVFERMIEGAMGDFLATESDFQWGFRGQTEDHVTVRPLSRHVNEVSLDLKRVGPLPVSRHFPIDATVQVVWRCVAGNLQMDVRRIRINPFPRKERIRDGIRSSFEAALARLQLATELTRYRCARPPEMRPDGSIVTFAEARPLPGFPSDGPVLGK